MRIKMMQMTNTPGSNSQAILTHHRFTAEQYRRMVDAAILTKYDRVELVDGLILDMAPATTKQQAMVSRLLASFGSLGEEEAILSVKGPVVLDQWSEFEPDLSLRKFRSDYYGDSLAKPEDVLLFIEVADSSLEWDRRVKVPMYAKAGLTEVWIVDVNGKTVEVMRESPDGGFYMTRIFNRREEVAPLAFPGLVLKLEKLFPG
jgi:Uma2 family endonuclease